MEYILTSNKHEVKNNWGGPTPFLPMKKCLFYHFSPLGKMGKKVYGKKGKSIHFPLFPYTFFPIFFHGKKWENTYFSMGKNGVGPPPPIIVIDIHFKNRYDSKINIYH